MVHLIQRQGPQGPELYCSICRVGVRRPNAPAVQAFTAQHAHQVAPVDPRYYGAGDLVALATGALGIPQCAPCQERQGQANRVLPRLWRR